MTKHYESFDDLIGEAPRSGPIGGDDVKSSRKVYAFFHFVGAVWAVHEDTRAERLVDLRDYIAGGHDPVRLTDSGTRALGTGGPPDGLYVYETSARAGTGTGYVSKRPYEAKCPTDHIIVPIDSECPLCGATITADE